jgi:hypothetical protein
MMRECYAELDRQRTDPDSPILRWDDAFRPASTLGLGEQHGAEGRHWIAAFAENDERPGDPDADAVPMTTAELVRRALVLLRDFGTSLVERAAPAPPEPSLVLSTDPIPPAPPPPHSWPRSASSRPSTRCASRPACSVIGARRPWMQSTSW